VGEVCAAFSATKDKDATIRAMDILAKNRRLNVALLWAMNIKQRITWSV